MKSGEFTKNVWKLALQIPPGKVTTYSCLAVVAGGHPMMARMITSILSKSPDVNKIPFHRIVYSNGKAWFDPKFKSQRLKLYKKEGIKLDKFNKIINFKNLIHTFNL